MSDAGVEVVTGEPVVETTPETARPAGTSLEVTNRQVATLAATGFAAGVVTAAVLGRRGGALRLRRRRRGQIVSSSSFLVDVHVLKR